MLLFLICFGIICWGSNHYGFTVDRIRRDMQQENIWLKRFLLIDKIYPDGFESKGERCYFHKERKTNNLITRIYKFENGARCQMSNIKLEYSNPTLTDCLFYKEIPQGYYWDMRKMEMVKDK